MKIRSEKDIIPLMGQLVKVFHRAEAVTMEKERILQRLTVAGDILCCRTGWVVGMTRLQTGKYHAPIGSGCTPAGDPIDYQPGYLTEIKTHPCLLVCFWPTKKPVKVLIEAENTDWYRHCEGRPLSPSEWSWKNLSPSEQTRVGQVLSHEAKTAARDEKGRFKKCQATA